MLELCEILEISVNELLSGEEIEQIAGYYECTKCHYKYIPKYESFLFSMHIGRTRYMKCPKCNEKSWNKKELLKNKFVLNE